MTFEEAAIAYLRSMMYSMEFATAARFRIARTMSARLSGVYELHALESDLMSGALLGHIAALEVKLSKADDPRVIGDSVLTWVKGYSAEETARALDIPVEDVKVIHRELGFFRENHLCGLGYGLEEVLYPKLKENAEDYTPQNPLRVMMGTTPSGPLHIANLYTLVTGAVSVQRAAKQARINNVVYTLGYNDLYAALKGHTHADIEERRKGAEEFIEEMRKVYGIEMVLEPFSELQRTDKFRAVLAEIAEKRYFGKLQYKAADHLAAARRGTMNFARLNRNENDEPFMERQDLDYVPTNLLDLMAFRDAADEVDVHILGGDQTHAGKILNPGRYVGKKALSVYITGIVFAPNGREMHVSNGNAVYLEEIKAVDGWLEKIAEMGNAPTRLIGPVEYRALLSPHTKFYGMK